jgi:glucokinase
LGGTKTLLALCNERGDVVRDEMFHCAEFDSLEAILDEFLGKEPIEAATIGVAGPVVDGVAHITNLPWTISEGSLGQKLGAPVRLLNDLQATAMGMLVLPATALHTLQAGPAVPGATIAVIAPGTEEELELWKFLRARHGAHVSVERVLSGNGIGDLYDFHGGKQTWEGDRNAEIATAAGEGTDPAAVAALTMWVAILGAEAGNHALRSLATGGVVIGGGIPPKILPALQTGVLLERFVAKGRFTTWMRSISLRVSLEPRAALYGAAHSAAMMRGNG